MGKKIAERQNRPVAYLDKAGSVEQDIPSNFFGYYFMLVKNADRTTYGINKITIAVLAFVIFLTVGLISWKWAGAPQEPWRLRTLVLCPMTMGMMLYICCDQCGVYFRCATLAYGIKRFIIAYLVFVALSLVTWIYLVPFHADPKAQVMAYTLTFIGGLWLRVARHKTEKKMIEDSPTLLVGTPDRVEAFVAGLEDDNAALKNSLKVIRPEEVNREAVRQILIDCCIHKVVYLPEGVDVSVGKCLVDLCGKMGVDFYAPMVVDMEGAHKTYFGVLGGARMLVYKSTPIPYMTSWQLKRLMDCVGALLLLLITSPLWVFAAVGIKLSSPGPVFFRQKRSGLYGREFGMWKFRTMYPDADKRLDEVKAKFGNEMDGPIFKLENDPRIFPLGKILRKFSIDELPQLLNVLKGEMSLVGPRPLPIYETAAFTSDAHRRRLSILPGVTGYWQISGRSDITEFERLVEMDMYYIDHWSLWLDLKLILKTVPAVLFGKGAK